MNKQPQPGEWWRTRSGEIRLVFGVNPCGTKYTVWTTNADDAVCSHLPSGAEFSGGRESPYDLVEHLPDCNSFDWQPVRYPRYFETRDREYYAYLRQDSATDLVLVEPSGDDYEGTEVALAGRTEITEAEAMSRIVPPKHDPGQGYRRINPAVDVPQEGDEFWHKSEKRWVARSREMSYAGWSNTDTYRRRIEPPTPKKTRTITFCEYIVWDEPGCERLVWALESDDMLYRHSYPTGRTRTIEVPE
jgi:hypothetical protein